MILLGFVTVNNNSWNYRNSNKNTIRIYSDAPFLCRKLIAGKSGKGKKDEKVYPTPPFRSCRIQKPGGGLKWAVVISIYKRSRLR